VSGPFTTVSHLSDSVAGVVAEARGVQRADPIVSIRHAIESAPTTDINADCLVNDALRGAGPGVAKSTVPGRVQGGHTYTRTIYDESDHGTLVEQWIVHGATHAWSGGSPDGSYTDSRGPDASAEMLRFFANI